jgi:hypothetical protein
MSSHSLHYWAQLKEMDEPVVIEFANGYYFVPGFGTDFKKSEFDWIAPDPMTYEQYEQWVNDKRTAVEYKKAAVQLWHLLETIETSPSQAKSLAVRRHEYLKHTGIELLTEKEWNVYKSTLNFDRFLDEQA